MVTAPERGRCARSRRHGSARSTRASSPVARGARTRSRPASRAADVGRRPRPRRRAAARHAGARRPGRRASPRARCRHARLAGRRVAQAGRRWRGSSRPSIARGLVRAQTPRVPAARPAARRSPRPSPDGRETFDRRGARCSRRAGVPVAVVPGEATTSRSPCRRTSSVPARCWRAPGPPRVGLGHDSHPFGPATGCALGGIRIAEAPAPVRPLRRRRRPPRPRATRCSRRPATGDLGRLFPAGDPATSGIDSRASCSAVVRRRPAGGGLAADGRRRDHPWRPAAPRAAAPRRDARRHRGARSAPRADAVAVTASTGNLDRATRARGRSITRHAPSSSVVRR